MTAKEWMSRYKPIEQSITAHKEHIAQLAAAVTSTTAKSNGGMPGSSGVSRKIENPIIQMDDIKAQIRELQKEQRAIVRAINAIKEPRGCAVLTYLYVCGFTLEETAQRMNYDRKTISRIREQALTHIRVPDRYIFTAQKMSHHVP